MSPAFPDYGGCQERIMSPAFPDYGGCQERILSPAFPDYGGCQERIMSPDGVINSCRVEASISCVGGQFVAYCNLEISVSSCRVEAVWEASLSLTVAWKFQ